MESVKVSSKFQIVIPKSVRNSLQLKVGESLQMLPYDGRIELVRLEPIGRLKGFLRGMNTNFEREEDRT